MAAATITGISTVGVVFSYAVETTAGSKPTGFTKLNRINSIDEFSIDLEQIDSSALEDEQEKNIAGRDGNPGSRNVTVNLTNETLAEWETLISSFNTAKAAGKATWFQVKTPNLTKAEFFTAEPPKKVPGPGYDQNGLLTTQIPLMVNSYEGFGTAVTAS